MLEVEELIFLLKLLTSLGWGIDIFATTIWHRSQSPPPPVGPGNTRVWWLNVCMENSHFYVVFQNTDCKFDMIKSSHNHHNSARVGHSEYFHFYLVILYSPLFLQVLLHILSKNLNSDFFGMQIKFINIDYSLNVHGIFHNVSIAPLLSASACLCVND